MAILLTELKGSSGEQPGRKSLGQLRRYEERGDALKCLPKQPAHRSQESHLGSCSYYCGASDFQWDQVILQHAEAPLATCPGATVQSDPGF